MKMIEKIVLELDELNKKNRDQKEKYEIEKKVLESKIKKYFESQNTRTKDFKIGGFNYRTTLVTQKNVKFKPDVLEQILDKEIFNEICKKKYEIIDYEGMVKYLKSLGAKPQEFKKFIACEKNIDNKKVNQLGELGDIKLEDLEGCYTVTENEGYIKITVSDDWDEEDS